MWHSGDKKGAFDMFGRILAFTSIPNAEPYCLMARGVFKQDTIIRTNPSSGPTSRVPLDEAGKKDIRDALNTFMRPYLRA
jgi:hypothetical protein